MKGKTVAASSRSWVVDMEKLLDTDAWLEEEQCERQHYIYRVPEWLKKTTDRSAYMPELVSLGPFHHGHRDLLPMEKHKRRAMLHLVKRSGKPLHEFVDAVEKVAEQLMGAYKDLTLQKQWRGGENIKPRFVEMMVVDGCFFVEVMHMVKHRGILDDDDNYASSDPVFSEHGYLYVWPTIKTDMILIENQLPLLLIETIKVLRDGKQKSGGIYESVFDLLGRDRNDIDCTNQNWLHPLDILHSSFTYTPSRAVANGEGCCQLTLLFMNFLRWLKSRRRRRQEDGTESDSTDDEEACAEMTREDELSDNASSAQKMREAGVRFKSTSDSFLDVHFGCCGTLSLPFLQFDGDTTMMLLNMMAFERLHATAQNHVTAYVYFLDDIIDTVKDVEVLKDAEIIRSEMGSDEELAKLVNNTLNSGLIMSPASKLCGVRKRVYAHCKKRRNKWRASLIDTHFSNPWVFISFLAAFILLGATLVQTYCAVHKC